MRRDDEMDELKNAISEALEKQVPRWLPWAVAGVIGAAAAFSSIYIVGPTQEGVVTRFGKYERRTGPGPHLKFPWPVEQVQTPEITEVKRLEIGFTTMNPGEKTAQYHKFQEVSTMLTGDENIVQSEFIVQYRIKDSQQYLFNVDKPVETLRDAAEAAHRQVIGDNGIDEVLTTGKLEIQNKTRETLQKIVDRYDMGVQIVAIQLQDVYPPPDVINAFKDVASAREDMARTINLAKAYQNEELPKARGTAEQLIRGAEAYRAERINRAKGDAARFRAILMEYEKAPKITEDRLYIETMNRIYPKLEKVIIDKNQQGLLQHLDVGVKAEVQK